MKNQNQQPTPTSQEQTEAKAEVIKLGIDVHQRRYVVVSQTDNEMMRSSRGFDPEESLRKNIEMQQATTQLSLLLLQLKATLRYVDWPTLPARAAKGAVELMQTA